MQKSHEQAVSEAIGFMILFTLVTMGIGLVTLYGYPVLMQQQTNAHERNMEQTMIVLQNDIKSLCYKNVPFKETSLSVGGGALSAYSNTSANQSFIITNSSGVTTTFWPAELRYQSDSGDGIIALENGAVIKAQNMQMGSVMLAEPRWFYDTATKTLVINNIAFDTEGGTLSRTGVGIVRMKVNEPSYIQTDEGLGTVTVEYVPGQYHYGTAWKNYLTGSGLGMNETGTNKYDRTEVQTLIIKTYEIDILSL